MQFDRDKFKNLVHYVIWKTSGQDGFGATKLYKVLWFAEARAFTMRRRPIAGETYIKQEHGPVPQHGRAIRAELAAHGLISEMKIDRGKYQEWVFKALQPPPKDFLSPDDKADVDYWIKHIDKDHTATSISDYSHDCGWEIAKIGDVLPYHAIWAERIREPTEADIKKAREKAKSLGLI